LGYILGAVGRKFSHRPGNPATVRWEDSRPLATLRAIVLLQTRTELADGIHDAFSAVAERLARFNNGDERVPIIIINDRINLVFFKLQSTFCEFQTTTVSECCLIKRLPYIVLEKYINISALVCESERGEPASSISLPMRTEPTQCVHGQSLTATSRDWQPALSAVHTYAARWCAARAERRACVSHANHHAQISYQRRTQTIRCISICAGEWVSGWICRSLIGC